MTRDDIVIAIDQDRDVETKGPDALGDLPDLLLAVTTGINGIRLKFSNRAVPDFQRLGAGVSRLFRIAPGRFHGSLPYADDSAHRDTRNRRTPRVQET